MVAQRIEQPTYRRFVAIGDSTTEGMDDPNGAGGYLGWADRLAERLSTGNPDLEYANLAIRGPYVARVRAEQLPVARDQKPDLASVIAGVNDLLRPRCDIVGLLGHLDPMYGTPPELGATVLTITQPTPVVVTQLAARRNGGLRNTTRASVAGRCATGWCWSTSPACRCPRTPRCGATTGCTSTPLATRSPKRRSPLISV
jgi:lysophospholipase L1-like esterase